jgi:hypothetical protein
MELCWVYMINWCNLDLKKSLHDSDLFQYIIANQKVAPPDLIQGEYQGILVKRRKIGHLEEDGGCGCEWFTFELPEDVLFGSMWWYALTCSEVTELESVLRLRLRKWYHRFLGVEESAYTFIVICNFYWSNIFHIRWIKQNFSIPIYGER